MRDQHRPKQDLINEVTALRKQVADLKGELVARRRVEDALRQSEEQLRGLADAMPVGLCLLRGNGSPLIVNRPFAALLGYDSPAELLRVGGPLGIFASREEEQRVLAIAARGQDRLAGAIFRRKDGTRQTYAVLGTSRGDPPAVALVVLERQPQPWRAPPLTALGAAWSGESRSA